MTNNPPFFLSENRTHHITWTLLCLMPIVGMAVDLVAPSLPAIATDLQVSSKIAKDIISIFILGYALGNFFTGILTDALGRLTLLRMSLLGFAIVSLIPVCFPRIEILLFARLLQGITIGAVAVLIRATLSDILPPEKLIRLGTLMGTMFGIGPVIGPVIGGYLQFYFGWMAGFCFFALIATFGTIAVFIVVPETHFTRQPLNTHTIKNNLREVLTHPIFLAIVILMGFMYSLIITFNTVGPFLIQTKLHYSPVFFGQLALCLGLAFLSATFTSRHLLKTYKVEQLYSVAINLFFVIAVSAVLICYFFGSNIFVIGITSAIMFFGCGFIFPMSMGKGQSLFRHIAGTAAATMYLVNMLITSLVAFLVSFINIQSALPLMLLYALLLLMGVCLYWGWLRQK